MPRSLALFFAVLLITTCGGRPAETLPPSPAASAAPAPSPAPSASPTPAAQRAPTPTRAAPTARAPTATPAPVAADATPAVSATPGAPGFDVAAQGAALLPDLRGDLDGAGAWDRYTISAEIDPRARTLSGRLTLAYTNRDSGALDRLYFRLFPNLPEFAGRLTVSAASVGGETLPIVYESRRYLLRLDLRRPLQPGEEAVVALDFTTQAPENAGRQFYGAFNLQGNVLSLASAYPIVALVRDGVWETARPDVGGDLVNSVTALYDVTLTLPADWKPVTTGVIVDGRLDAGKQTVRIVSGPQRDFLFSATTLPVVSDVADGTRVNSYYRPGEEAGGRAALRAAVNAITVFNRRFGRYPLAEFDLVPVDAGTFLGVEYPGMTLIEQRLYRNDPRGLEITVAHEVAHQWWYSTVGNDVQREAWLDEALASYSQVIYAEEIDGAEAAERELDDFRATYRSIRSAGRDGPVAQENATFRGSYFGVVYAKGALFFQALRERIGDEAFDRFIKEYYATHRYGVTTGADLMGAAEAGCSCELDDLYWDWILTAERVEIP